MFVYATSVTGRVGRNAHRLFVPQINTNYGKQSLYYRGATLWNALPMALHNLWPCTTYLYLNVIILVM